MIQYVCVRLCKIMYNGLHRIMKHHLLTIKLFHIVALVTRTSIKTSSHLSQFNIEETLSIGNKIKFKLYYTIVLNRIVKKTVFYV